MQKIHEGRQVETLKRAAKVDNTGDNGQTTMFNLDVQLWWQCKTLKLSIYTIANASTHHLGQIFTSREPLEIFALLIMVEEVV